MQTPLDDTHPKIREMQISLIRKAGIARRIMDMRSLSKTVVNLSRRAVSRRHPECSQQEIDLIFVRLHYGDDLAGRLRAYLDRKTR